MDPVMTIRHTEDVHVQCVLLFRPSGNLAFGRENIVQELFAMLASNL